MTASRPIFLLTAPLMLLGLATLLLDPYGLATAARGALWDGFQSHAAKAAPHEAASSLRILEIDPASIAQNGAWPWNQTKLAALARAVSEGGARAMVFIGPFSGSDTSPKLLAARLPPGPAYDSGRAALAALPSPQDDLAAALKSVPTVLAVALGGTPPHARTRFEYRGRRNPFGSAPDFSDAPNLIGAPPQALTASAAGLGAVNLPADRDGVVRRMPSVTLSGGVLLPSLALEAARVSTKGAALIYDGQDYFFGAHLAGFEIGGHEIATDSDGGFWLDYGRHTQPPIIAASALLQGTLNPLALNDAVVIISPPGAEISTPLGPQSAGAVLAQGLSNLLTGQVLVRPFFALPAEFAFLLGGGIIILVLLMGRWIYWAGLFAAICVMAALYASWFFFVTRHWLLDAATPGIALGLCFAAGAMVRLSELRRARIGLRLAFADSLPRASIEKIARLPSLLTIEGETRNVTYLVCGVRGLAGLAAGFRDDPKGFTRLLQQVLSPLLDQALAYGGTIDRLTADGFAAFWNAPLDDADHALHACEAANGMSIMAARVSEELAAAADASIPQLEIGVGIATGNVIAGGFGGHGRLGYSVNGEAPALAARLQTMSGQYGPAVIVSEETQKAAARGFAFLEVDMIAAGAKDAPVRLYAMLGNPVVRSSPKFRALITFHEHIFQSLRAQQWGKARALIEQCRRLSGASQRLYDLHLARIRYFEINPPGENWDGAFRPILK